MAIATYTKAGNKAATAAKLDATVFGITVENHDLLKQAYVAYLSNGRENLAVTKKRGEVSGGGRKPWKQKGTGRARFGSSRNPIWRGGGVAFGPTGIENYSKGLNIKAKRLALRQALSLASNDGKIIVLEDLSNLTKTSEMVKLMAKIGADKRSLVVVEHKTDELVRASNNLQDIKLVQPAYVNIYDVLNADHIVITSVALAALSTRLGGDK